MSEVPAGAAATGGGGSQARLAARYGTARRKRGDVLAIIIGGGLLTLLVGAFFVLMLSNHSVGNIEFYDRSHEILDENVATLTFDVTTARPNTPVECAIKALSATHAPLGYDVLWLEPSAKLRRTVTHELRTVAEPVTVTVDSCWVVSE